MDIVPVDLLVTFVLALIMVGIGLSLTISEFKHIFRHPKALFAALFSQMIALPLIAFAIASMSNLSPEIKVGLIILAASPGGSTSGLLTYLLRGNVALSVSLTTLNSLLTLFTIPLIVNLALDFYLHTNTLIELPFADTMIHIFVVTIIPASLGIWIRNKYPPLAIRIEAMMKNILLIALFTLFGIKMFAGESQGGTGLTWTEALHILPYTLALLTACWWFGYYFLRLWGLPARDRLTAAIESGVHNTALAILIAGTLIKNQEMVKPILIYALTSFWIAWLFGYLANSLLKKKYKF